MFLETSVPDLPAAVDLGLLVLRVLFGVVFAAHGFQKLFGWFGGGGPEGTANWFKSLGFGDGKIATFMAGGSEIAGGLGMALGLLTPLAAAAVVGTMTTAGFVNNADNGFWSAKKGWETNWYLIVIAVALAVTGPGAWSLDAALGIHVSGIAAGLVAVVLGVGGGSMQWFSRDTG